jgi:hypothetical protein
MFEKAEIERDRWIDGGGIYSGWDILKQNEIPNSDVIICSKFQQISAKIYGDSA